MKKFMVGIMILVTSMVAMAGCSQDGNEKQVTQIGLTQIAEHPSLDMINEGIRDALESNGYVDSENIKIDYKNAQGSMDIAYQIANSFSDKDLVIAITTPSAQAAFNALEDIPIIYSGVTAPESAGLIGANITGVSDMTPIQKQFDLMMELFPETKEVGMVYNTNEVNSEIQVQLAKEIVKGMGLDLIVSGITNTDEMALAMDTVLEEVDILYTQVDNSIAAAYPMVMAKANEKSVPVIGGVEDYVTQGAIATDGINNYTIGYQTGEMISRILDGESIEDNPFETIKETELSLNKEVLEKYNIDIDETLANKATIY
ncbi:ABC transporter substrate-binding protein [Vallitalea okinawensis]|uniref:ABC transporter substrate-binding protein n=1 Tax=Vallitalea okinawensis TaxID=2078660 RepID=UPI001300A9E6|nr:ABC transporter substrate-binding protein [Vallitalea okinawensis]